MTYCEKIDLMILALLAKARDRVFVSGLASKVPIKPEIVGRSVVRLGIRGAAMVVEFQT